MTCFTPDVDEAGHYRFEGLPGGTYVVRQEVPDILSATPATASAIVVTVGPADDRSDIDGGDRYRPSEIHGVKYEDLNGNGIRDAGEPGVEGVTIFIDLNRDDVFDEGIEPSTLTLADGSYQFTGLDAGAYVVREIVPSGWIQTSPGTSSVDGILWPGGVSHPAVGNVTPGEIRVSLAEGETYTTSVSLTLPNTGAITNMVDVFLLFDDTGSFTSNSPIVRAAFPNIITQLQTRLPGIDLGFGVGRLEEYGNFAAEYATGRPFTLNQPIISSSPTGYTDAEVQASIQAALDHVAPGYGGDQPETVIEALYQMVTGAGFDGNNDCDTTDSGPAGGYSTQVSPGTSGDVPAFSSFTADTAHGGLDASGTIGGAGFRSGALPIIITATDTGFAYQPKGETSITGNGTTLPVSAFTGTSRGTTPFGAGAGIQETVTGLNALGALVIGLGTADAASAAPRSGLEALATVTGAVNQTTTSIANGTADPIDPGDPFYFKIGSGGDPLVGNIADGIVAAIDGAVTSVSVNVTLRASDPRVHIAFSPGVIPNLSAGQRADFAVTFTGDGRPERFDLQFVREGTDVVLGSIPVVLGTPIVGEGYEYEDCEDGEYSTGIDFGNQRIDGFVPNVAPGFVVGPNQLVAEDSGSQTVANWATGIIAGPASESAQVVDFIVSSDSPALFSVQPAVSPDGTLTYTPAANAFGTAIVTVQIHDNGGTAMGGVDTSVSQTFTIDIAPVNDAPTGSVVIVGVATEGEVLTADVSSIADADGLGPFSYLWSTGATSASITLTDADVGSNITVTVTYTDVHGTAESLTSAPVGPVANVNATPTGDVVITGAARNGQVLTAVTSGIRDADGLGAFSIQWLRDGVAIAGATGISLTLSGTDVGARISVQVSYIDGHGTTEGPLVSLSTEPVADLPVSSGDIHFSIVDQSRRRTYDYDLNGNVQN
ncbi:MAG: SdrD B-like domain-containing protein, partial [Planctomycetaceae bacterium]